jgi:CO/xanthine dehydrogenase Mo-binding subunit
MGKVIASYYGEKTSQNYDLNQQLNIKLPDNPLYIGKRRLVNKEGYAKASGKAVFTKDIFLPGMLWAKGISRGPTAHAKIKSMDTKAAEALPGVRAILRYDDPELQGQGFTVVKGRIALESLSGTAEHGDHLVGCIICADTEEICDRALDLVKIEWEELTVILDWNEAIKASAPIVSPEIKGYEKTNILTETTSMVGDVDAGLKQADKVIEFAYDARENTTTCIETMENVAQWQGDILEVWHRQQRPMHTIYPLGKVTKSITNIVMHIPYQGAQFGGSNIHYGCFMPVFVAILAKRTGRPVHMKYEEHFFGSGNSYGSYKYKVGFKNDGTLTAVDMDAVQPANGGIGIADVQEGTFCPNTRLHKITANCSRGYMTVFRDGGQNAGPLQQVINRVAAELGKDPSEVMLKNLGTAGETWDEWADYRKQKFLQPDRNSYKECLAAAKKAFDWDAKWHAPGTKILPNGRYHGVGFCSDFQWTNMRRPALVCLMVKPDGTVTINTGCASTGEGQRTVYSAVVADELGVKYSDVNLPGFTECGYWVQHGGGSQGTATNVPVLALAARKAKRMLLELACLPVPQGSAKAPRADLKPPAPTAAAFPGLTWDKLDVKEGVIFEKAKPDNKKTVAQVAGAMWPDGISIEWREEPVIVDQFAGPVDAGVPHCRQVHMLEVEVDPDTGKVYVTKVVCVNDLGKAMNPDTVNGQQYGGAGMGIGTSCFEEVIYDQQTGLKLNNNLLGYELTLMNDYAMPECIIVETQQGFGAYGTCGMGEDVGGTMIDCTMQAIFNATGKWVSEWPTTPNIVLKALGKG